MNRSIAVAVLYWVVAAAGAQEKTPLKPFEYQDARVPFYPGGGPWGRTGEPLTKMQKPIPAEESVRHMVVPPGMRAEVFAAEPEIRRPICMNWDSRGRLWIAETIDYPNELRPAGKGRDRIVICDDADGDGRADSFKIFAEGLSIPTSFTFARGGVVVTQAPDTLFLADTDGDDRADVRKILFTGWGIHDTHAGPSNLVYGFDNWIYGIVGYSGFDGVVAGEKHRFANGFFRFKPDGMKLEFLRSTSNNSWGVGFNEDGDLFGSTANGDASVHLAIANRHYETVRGLSAGVLSTIADSQAIFPITDKIRQVDHHGRFTAAAGHALYTARAYPKEYWNRVAFVAEPTGHLVAHFRLEPKGATFVARNLKSFLASDDEWTAPIAAEVGPDGQMWVIDWYNYIIQHNPTPPGFETGRGNAYETPLRDKTHGRILRVVHGRDSEPPPRFDVDRPETLLAGLVADNFFWRKHAQRLLVERGRDDVAAALVKLVRDPAVDELGLNVGAIHALWTLHGLGLISKDRPEVLVVVAGALDHQSAAVRRAALWTLPRDAAGLAILLAIPSGDLKPRIERLVADVDARVTVAALTTLAEMPAAADDALGPILVRCLTMPATATDPIVRDAVIIALAAHRGSLFTQMARLTWPRDSVLPEPRVLERVVAHDLREGAAPGRLVVLADRASTSFRRAIVAGLVVDKSPRDAKVDLDADAVQSLGELMSNPDAAVARPAATLAARWRVASLQPRIRKLAAEHRTTAADNAKPEADRLAAVRSLIELRGDDPAVMKELAAMVSPRLSPDFARKFVELLGTSDQPALGSDLTARLPLLTPAARSAAVRVLTSRPEWTSALLDAIESGDVKSDGLSLDQKQSLLNHPAKALAARARDILEKSGNVPSPDRAKVLAEWMPTVPERGDAETGKKVFLQHCAKCHRHGSDGAKIGPDLTGMAVHPPAHLLAEILDPNRSVEGNFRQYVVTTNAGRVLVGLLAAESKTAIEIVDAEAKTHVVPRDEIDELQATPRSLMPEGFEKQMTPRDMSNLLAFLTARGRHLPLPLDRAATTVSTRGMFHDEASPRERLAFDDWSPKTFAGVPFRFIDPQGGRIPNIILLQGPPGSLCAGNPRSVSVPCNSPAAKIHILGGVAGWAYPGGVKGSTSMVIRLHYKDGTKEDHLLKNGEAVADSIRRVDVPGSTFAFQLGEQQIRYLSIAPGKNEPIERIEFRKGDDATAPIVMAVTVEP